MHWRSLDRGWEFVVAWRTLLTGACLGAIGVASADEPGALLAEPLAAAFGAQPSVWGLRLSPDGTKLSFMHLNGPRQTAVSVLDLTDGSGTAVMGNDPDDFEITWCDWANDTRLLCGVRFPRESAGVVFALTRLVGVDIDASDMKVLAQREMRERNAQRLDQVVDWLPEDPGHVLIQVPTDNGYTVGKLDIYSGAVRNQEPISNGIYRWITDGRGTPRLYQETRSDSRQWYVRETPDSDWSLLHEAELRDLAENFTPIGFGEDPNTLYFFDRLNGRLALYAMDLANGRERTMIYAHPSLDVANVYRYGRYRRLAAVAYADDRPRLHFFDARLERIHTAVTGVLPEQIVSILDEDWSQRYYLFYAGSPTNAGEYYRYDADQNVLLRLFPAYATLEGRALAEVRTVTYPSHDGTPIPAYLTLPASGGDGPKPAVVLPHGGPASRDVWSYDFLAQFLAAKGYVVLQSNYRGSAGYGSDWQGLGGFQDWRIAIDDIVDGAGYLVESDIAAAGRLCTIGWSYGGYAALLSVIEEPDTFECVVAIAAVTDPRALSMAVRRNFVGGLAAQAFIGMDRDELRRASPVDRADEIAVPALLFHARQDMNVPFGQGSDLARALEREDKTVELIEYEYAEHSIRPQHYRIDMLSRIGAFLDTHLGR